MSQEGIQGQEPIVDASAEKHEKTVGIVSEATRLLRENDLGQVLGDRAAGIVSSPDQHEAFRNPTQVQSVERSKWLAILDQSCLRPIEPGIGTGFKLLVQTPDGSWKRRTMAIGNWTASDGTKTPDVSEVSGPRWETGLTAEGLEVITKGLHEIASKFSGAVSTAENPNPDIDGELDDSQVTQLYDEVQASLTTA